MRMAFLSAAALLSLLCLIEGTDVGQFGPLPGSRSVQHGVSGTISFADNSTILIQNFNYDGTAPTVFWYYYRSDQQAYGAGGLYIPHSSSSRSLPRRSFSNEDVVLKMPSGTTVCDIQVLTVWCERFNAFFAQVTVNKSEVLVNNGEGECRIFGGNVNLPELPTSSYNNCISFSSSLQLQWTVDTPNNEIDFEMCSCRSDNPQQNQYMGFGVSGDSSATFMVGADVTIAWLDNRDGQPNAVDYFITGRAQCRGGQGVCPDTMVADQSCVDNIDTSKLKGGVRNNRQQCIIFSRNFTTGDSQCDLDFNVTSNQYIVWAIGGLGETAFIHFERSGSDTMPLLLSRPADRSSCDSRPIQCRSCPSFSPNKMVLKSNTTLRLTIGPSGQERGYMAITGQSGWGISWYVNDTLIPELVLTRGMTYTFIIEGGNTPETLSIYHPFYISNSINGGRLRNTPEQRQQETVYAGFDGDSPTGVGRLCQTEETSAATTAREGCMEESQYFSALTQPCCGSGEPGTLVWTPDNTVPDTVYYQCATHQNLGWRIKLEDPDLITTSDLDATAAALAVFTSVTMVIITLSTTLFSMIL